MSDFVLTPDQWPRMPAAHRTFLESAIPTFRSDLRLVGLAAGGSMATGGLDEHSDLDLIVVAEPETYEDVLREGGSLARKLGPLLAAFPGDHVGELRLLICLYGPPLFHVDLKFLSAHDLDERVEDPIVLWDRDGAVRDGLSRGSARYPQPDFQWIEDRFWVWVHYTVVKIARGELFEAVDSLAFLRRRVLGPLILLEAGSRPDGVRRLETRVPALVPRVASTVGGHDRVACREALLATIALYTELRERLAPSDLLRRVKAEAAAKTFVDNQLQSTT